MYLHLGQETVIRSEEIIGIFDMETSTLGPSTRGYLSKSEREGHVVNVSLEMPKSFVLCRTPGGKETVYITQISSSTLLKRAGFMEGLRNVNNEKQERMR
ncbi:MAG: DUF370 domain-containing protein [Oscillospiraceae bacterium]|jgi:hypothetical protein|nr:DUF370 domain-containing protein [Oscillospiraceae bacterium]